MPFHHFEDYASPRINWDRHLPFQHVNDIVEPWTLLDCQQACKSKGWVPAWHGGYDGYYNDPHALPYFNTAACIARCNRQNMYDSPPMGDSSYLVYG